MFVYGDANDQWVQSRGVWNQHSYHITNVNDDGTIPVNEVPSWTSVNSYRSNRFTAVEGGVPVDGCAFAKPDLTASFLRIDTATATGGAERRLTARIGNAGNAVAGAGTPVSFYDGNPLLGGRKLATTALSMILGAGSFEDVEILVDVNTTTESSIWVVADDFGGLIGTVSESDEDNNAFDSGLSLVGASGAGLADLAITSVDTTALDVDSSTLDVNISGTLAATVRNQGELAVSGPFDVVFFEDANANGTYERASTSCSESPWWTERPPWTWAARLWPPLRRVARSFSPATSSMPSPIPGSWSPSRTRPITSRARAPTAWSPSLRERPT